MRACLDSLSLLHHSMILFLSDRGMLTYPPNFCHRASDTMSRTMERFIEVRLGSDGERYIAEGGKKGGP